MLSARCSMHIYQDATDMSEIMAWADVAIVAAGGTLWELLFMGCPVVSYVRNDLQRKILNELEKQNVVSYQGYASQMDEKELALSVAEIARSQARCEQMSTMAQLIVDGEGANRVLQALINGTEN